MSAYSFVARTLATAFLGGGWSPEELQERGRLALLGSVKPGKGKLGKQWLIGVVSRLLNQFGKSVPRPCWSMLAVHLSWDPWVRRQSRDPSEWPKASLLWLPPQQMFATCDHFGALPSVTTLGGLSKWLGLGATELDWFADCHRRERLNPLGPLRHYRYRLLRKPSGRLRLLEIPKVRLKALQHKILHGILDLVPAHPAAHAFQSGKSVASYVEPHAGRRVALHIDLREFFPSIRYSRIHALFRTLGYLETVAQKLAGLCTNSAPHDALIDETLPALDASVQANSLAARLYQQAHLPQGAPTSPALANLCAYRLDVRLQRLARRFGASYTRYADDLLFSGDRDFEQGLSRFRILACAIVLNEGFDIRALKTRVMRAHQSQRAAGIVFNSHPNVKRSEFDSLKALLFNCIRFGPASQNRNSTGNFQTHLAGRIAYVAMVNARRGEKLRTLFERINWSDQTQPCGDDTR